MKRAIIVVLVCINTGLLLGVMMGAGTPKAYAQGYFDTDYLMVTGKHIGTNSEAVYIIDLKREALAGLRFDRAKMRLFPIGVRDLKKDFGRGSRVQR